MGYRFDQNEEFLFGVQKNGRVSVSLLVRLVDVG